MESKIVETLHYASFLAADYKPSKINRTSMILVISGMYCPNSRCKKKLKELDVGETITCDSCGMVITRCNVSDIECTLIIDESKLEFEDGVFRDEKFIGEI